jgi:hypothetical protein
VVLPLLGSGSTTVPALSGTPGTAAGGACLLPFCAFTASWTERSRSTKALSWSLSTALTTREPRLRSSAASTETVRPGVPEKT